MLKKYLKALQQKDTQCKKKKFANKGKNTLFNSYIKNKFKSICYKFWAKSTALSPKCHFYIFVDILLSHYMFTCNNNKCSAKILNLFIFKFKGKSLIYCMFLIFIICAGKQN